MEIVLIIMVVILGVFLWRYYLLLNGIKQIRKQLKVIHEAQETNQLITSPHHFLELQKLIQEINTELSLKQQHLRHFRDVEQNLKEQITNISHDVRTPLASILGYFELMADESATAEEKAQYLNIIKRRAGLLRNLLDHYYELVQIESEAQALQITVVNIEALLIDVLAMFYYDFSEKAIAVDFAGELNSFKVLADKALLQRVFVNLIQNVLNHGDERCEIIHETYENQICTVIKNKIVNGNQIEIEKVFNRLYAADKTRNTGNTGIGLTITKLLIEKMGHKIQAELCEDWFLIRIVWQI